MGEITHTNRAVRELGLSPEVVGGLVELVLDEEVMDVDFQAVRTWALSIKALDLKLTL